MDAWDKKWRYFHHWAQLPFNIVIFNFKIGYDMTYSQIEMSWVTVFIKIFVHEWRGYVELFFILTGQRCNKLWRKAGSKTSLNMLDCIEVDFFNFRQLIFFLYFHSLHAFYYWEISYGHQYLKHYVEIHLDHFQLMLESSHSDECP